VTEPGARPAAVSAAAMRDWMEARASDMREAT
jgi:hypothetical protein